MNIKSVTRWFVMSEFEMLLNCLGVATATILLCLRLDYAQDISWKLVFTPMFVTDGMQFYFCIIVLLRQFFEFQQRPWEPVLRFVISSLFLITRFLFKLFVYLILVSGVEGDNSIRRLQYAMFPLFLHLILLIFRSCRLKKYQI